MDSYLAKKVVDIMDAKTKVIKDIKLINLNMSILIDELLEKKREIIETLNLINSINFEVEDEDCEYALTNHIYDTSEDDEEEKEKDEDTETPLPSEAESEYTINL